MKRILAAAAIATATLTTLSLAGAGAVSAGTSSQAAAAQISTTYSRGEAGYSMSGSGWRFRYIETTLTVPACSTRASRASLTLGNDNDAVVLWVNCGGGPGSIVFWISYATQGTPLAVQPNVGDQVTISIFHDQSALQDHFTAVDHTQGTSATGTLGARQTWVVANVSGGGPTWSFASSDTRLWAFQDTRLTSYGGIRGAILGPWNTYRIAGTRGASPTGAVVLWPRYPFNNGHNFNIWWYAAR
jgi:hypothetical protein